MKQLSQSVSKSIHVAIVVAMYGDATLHFMQLLNQELLISHLNQILSLFIGNKTMLQQLNPTKFNTVTL